MNKLVIVARRHGSEQFEVISGPDVSPSEQHEKFMPFRLNETHPDFDLAVLCSLQVERQCRLSKPVATKTAKTK